MARVIDKEGIVGIVTTDMKGVEGTIFAANREHPLAIVMGAFGGVRCTSITAFDKPAFDGARSIVDFGAFYPWGFEVNRTRVMDSAEDIIAAYKEAGLCVVPVVVAPSRTRRWIESLRRAVQIPAPEGA